VLVGTLRESDLSDEVVTLPRALAEPLARHQKVSAVSLPAAESGLVRGALLFAHQGSRAGVGRDVVDEFTVRASRAVSAAYRFERQKSAADELTSPLRPPVLPVVPGIRMASIYRPSAGPVDVGGDFYDIHLQDDGSSLFVLGDVCGKGAEAAAMSGRVRHALAALRLVEGEPRRLLRLINQALLGTGGSKFATIVVGLMTRRSGGSLLMRVSSGGHPAPLVVRRDGVEVVAVPGMLVGIMPKAEFGESTVELGPQDTFVAYTDGITEARGGTGGEELFGTARLRAVLADCAGAPVERVVAHVDDAVQQWTNGRSRDDIALLAIQSAPGQ
jgi:serine phosphatase RsbU (regulator of sigma subunit)